MHLTPFFKHFKPCFLFSLHFFTSWDFFAFHSLCVLQSSSEINSEVLLQDEGHFKNMCSAQPAEHFPFHTYLIRLDETKFLWWTSNDLTSTWSGDWMMEELNFHCRNMHTFCSWPKSKLHQPYMFLHLDNILIAERKSNRVVALWGTLGGTCHSVQQRASQSVQWVWLWGCPVYLSTSILLSINV